MFNPYSKELLDASKKINMSKYGNDLWKMMNLEKRGEMSKVTLKVEIDEESYKQIKGDSVYDNNNESIIGKSSSAYYALDAMLKATPITECDNAMQVELEGDGYADGEIVYDHGKCPKCGWTFEDGDKDWEAPFCCNCGQRLHWFDSEVKA